MIYYKNAKAEWEEELRNNPDCNIEDYKDWRAENNFGVKHFGMNPK